MMRRLRLRRVPRREGSEEGSCLEAEVATEAGLEAGEALIEFLAVMILFVIPVFYIILALGQLQASTYAAEAAARNAARILAANPNASVLAERQAQLAFSDFGLPAPAINANCQPSACPTNGVVTVSVEANTPLPLVPDWVGARVSFPVIAQVSMPVEGLSVEGL